MKWIEIFKTGTHTDSKGATRTWSEADLNGIVGNFDAEQSAPAVIGHPKTDDPAWGWVDKLRVEGGKLLASFRDLVPEFVESVRAGRYRKVSVALFPEHDGTFALRHVGFLGATPPAVQGLAPANFQQGENDLVVEFALEPREANTLIRVLRGIREWFIEERGIETANQIIPDWEIEQLQPREEPAFNQPTEGEDMSKEQIEQAVNTAVEAAKGDLSKEFSEKEKSYQEQIEALQRDGRRRDMAAFAEEQVRAGKLAPKALQLGVVEFMLRLDQAVEVQFSEGDGGKLTPLGWFQEFIRAMPEAKLFGALGGQENDPGTVDASEQEKAIQEVIAAEKEAGREISYAEATKRAASSKPEVFAV